MDENASVAAVHGFLQRYTEDREAGRERSLEDYQACFPGHERAIATKHRELLAASEGDELPSSWRSGAGPQRIGRFQILEELGRGGQGVVYLAEDPELHRRVALKVLSFGHALSPEAQRRFQREAETASRIEHPGICAVHEIGQAEGLVYIAMQYVEGETLAKKIARAKEAQATRLALDVATPSPAGRGPTSQTRSQPSELLAIVRLIERVAMALHAAHEAGIVHRDVKPGNIRVTPRGEPVLLDFGLARDDASEEPTLTQSGDVLGTPAYLSPEQLQAKHEAIDRRTDVYSLAVTLYECLTLRRPFEAPTREGLYRSILDDEPTSVRTLNPRVPRDLAVVLETALQKNHDHRYMTALAFAEELGRVCERRPILTRRTGPLVRTWRWAERNPTLASALGGLVLVLAIGLAVTGYLLEEARVALGNFDRLSLVQKLEDAKAALEEVYPVGPEKVPAMEAWLREYWAPIEAAWPEVTAILARLVEGEEPEVRDLFLRNTLAKLAEDHREFSEGPAAAAALVHEDLAWSRVVERETNDAHAEAWRAASEAIAADPLYRGLQVAPQLGLIPLGPDPDSGLFEFYHLRSAAPDTALPRRDPSGRIRMTGEMGLVFVLLPGAIQLVGAQKDDPAKPNYLADADQRELELQERLIDPFFLSKFELTQGQWSRLSREENGSEFKAGTVHFGLEVTWAHPSEPGWDMISNRHLVHNGLRTPREAEWEYACRAGTDTPWYTGTSPGTLHGHENIGDRTAGAMIPEWNGGDDIESDGHVIYAPVGSFEPNPFGFHDMHGNVTEWCTSWATDGRTIVCRGGNFRTDARTSRSTARRFIGQDHGNGLRPACDVRQGLFVEQEFPGRAAHDLVCTDLDGDGLADVFGLGPFEGGDATSNQLILNSGEGRFENVTRTHLPESMDAARVCATADVDGDGDTDLLTAQGWSVRAQSRLHLNDGSGHMVDGTAASLPLREDNTQALDLGDFDGDGDADLYLGNVGGDAGEPSRLYLNELEETRAQFRDVTGTHLPPARGQVHDRTGALAHGDVDQDGDLDVFCGNWHYLYQNRLFLNDGRARFTDVTEDHVPPMHLDRDGVIGDITLSVVLGDLDGDGDDDLVCGNGWGVRAQLNRLYLNDGSGRFRDVSETNLPRDRECTRKLALGDIDGDGDPDLVAANGGTLFPRDRFYINDGKGSFRDVSATHCPNLAGGGLALADVDHDGDLDLFLLDATLKPYRLRIFLNRTR